MTAANNNSEPCSGTPDGNDDTGRAATRGGKARKDRWIKGCFLAAVLIAAVIVYVMQREGVGLHGWEDDLEAALVRAERENRPLLVYFVRSFSADTVRRMASTTLAKPDNERAIQEAGLIKVKVKTSIDSDLAKKYGLSKLPTMVVLSPEGRKCATINDYAGQFIGELPFRNEFLEPKLEGWLGNNFQDALRNAGQAGKPVLALFAAVPSSGETRRLAFTTLAAEAAKDRLDKGRFVKVAVRLPGEEHPLAKQYAVARFPTLLIITPTGEHHRREGFVTLEQFTGFLASAAPPAAAD
jgi:thioredoxin-related protein